MNINDQEPSLETLLSFVDNEGSLDPSESIDDSKVFGEPKNFDEETEIPDPQEDEIEEDEELILSPSQKTTDIVQEDNIEAKDANEGYKEYYGILQESGLLFPNDDFEFTGSSESLAEALKQTSANLQKSVFTAFWEKLPEEWRPALQYALNGGVDVEAYLNTFKSVELDKLNIKGSTEDQRKILREYYKVTNPKYDDSKINKLIDRLEVLGEMEEEATSALEDLKEIEQDQRKELAFKQEKFLQEQEQANRAKRDSIATVIDSSNIADNRKGKVKAYIFNLIQDNQDSTPTTQFNKAIENMYSKDEHLVQLADFLLDSYDPVKGFNFERYIKKGVTSSNKTIKEKLESLKTKTSVTGSASKISNGDFNWDLFLAQN